MVILVKAEFLEKLHGRSIRSFIDVLVLTELEKRSAMSGYDVIEFIHKEFGKVVSSGTVYSILYSLERNQLVKGRINGRARVYSLTDKGDEAVKALKGAKEEFQELMARIFRIDLEKQQIVSSQA